MVQDGVAGGLQRHGRMVEQFAQDVRLLDLPGGVRLAWGLEGVERGPDGRVVDRSTPASRRPRKYPSLVAMPAP